MQNFNYYQYQTPTYMPLTFVSGIEGAKAYIVAPNSTMYLMDSEANVLYVKSADNMGKYKMNSYELKDLETIPTKEERKDILNDINTKIDKLYEKFEEQFKKEES